jgi:histidine kinase
MHQLSGYTILEQLYESSRTVIERARREADGLAVVVKHLRDIHPNATDLGRRSLEYDMLRSIDSPRVVRAVALETVRHSFALVLEDSRGTSLASYLSSTRPDTATGLRIAVQLAEALEAIHARHIIHKDVTPGNIIIAQQTGDVMLIDFDIASPLVREQADTLHPRHFEGTLAYMAPEQTGRMNRSVDYRADFYALGITLYELFTGQRPFSATEPLELVHCHIARAPYPPHELAPDLPEMVSRIILRLLEKNPEDRYQSAFGLRQDLVRCADSLISTGAVAPFEIATHDAVERLQIPQKLYGRRREIELLLAAFDRAVAGSTELMLISGWSGIGKTALVQEIHEPVLRMRGHFISGKYDEFGRTLPYSAIIAAFQQLVRNILTEEPAIITAWRERLLAALHPLGSIIIDVIPEVSLIIGAQDPVRDLPPFESQNRFNSVFLKFIHVFMQPEHPLVLFLDDLQWADTASVNLLHLLMTEAVGGHLLLIGAYRSNELDADHPLATLIVQLRGSSLHEVELLPLAVEDQAMLLSDTLRLDPAYCSELAQLVNARTAGNPFFINELLKTLHERSLLRFDMDRREWTWDLEEIMQEDLTDSMVELVAGKLRDLPAEVRELLEIAACIGSHCSLQTISLIRSTSPLEVRRLLWRPLTDGLMTSTSRVARIPPSLHDGADMLDEAEASRIVYRFAHDRIREAAYSLIDTERRSHMHLHVGRLLLEHRGSDDRIFDIVNQLNLGAALMTDESERLRLAALNLEATRQARRSNSYGAAQRLATAGIALLPDTAWEQHYDLTRRLHFERYESEYMLGHFEEMERLFADMIDRIRDPIDKLPLYTVRLIVYTALGQYDRANRVGIEGLRLVGILLPQRPGRMHVLASFLHAKLTVGRRPVMDLLHLPDAKDHRTLTIMHHLSDMIGSSYQGDLNLFALVVLHMVRISIRHGNTIHSPHGYNLFGSMIGVLGDYKNAVAFGMTGNALSRRYNDMSSISRTHLVYGMMLCHWKSPLTENLTYLNTAFRTGADCGDFHSAMYAANHIPMAMLLLGHSLQECLTTNETCASFSMKVLYQDGIDFSRIYRQTARCLMGLTRGPASFTDDDFDEVETASRLRSNIGKIPLHWLAVCRMYTFCFTGEYLAAFLAGEESERHVIVSGVFMHALAHRLYFALAIVLAHDALTPAQRARGRRTVKRLLSSLRSVHGENVDHVVALIHAEQARIAGNVHSAEDRYITAIERARAARAVHIEALAHERLGRLSLARGRADVATSYLSTAIFQYGRWGAAGTVARLQQEFPLLSARIDAGGTSVESAQHEHVTQHAEQDGLLDVSSVLKASQAISGTIVLQELLGRLMHIVIENAGAERGVLIMNRAGRYMIEAVSTVAGSAGSIITSTPLEDNREVAIGIIQFVMRTRETMVVDDACNDRRVSSQPYVAHNRVRSVLCMPIVGQGKLLGALYLENNLVSGCFTQARIRVLSLLSGQIAISLENALLYENLEHKVSERTAELQAKNEQLAVTLDQLQKTQGRLIQAEKMASLGQLTAGIAHEMRNPLNFVNNFSLITAELVDDVLDELDRTAEPTVSDVTGSTRDLLQTIRDNVHRVREHSMRANRIVEQMLQHSHRPTGTREPVSLRSLIDNTLDLVHTRLQTEDPDFALRIERDFAEDIPSVHAVPQELVRVFTNITSNAIHALRTRHASATDTHVPVLRCGMHADAQHVHIRIADNGVGIPSDIRDKIFQPFFTTKPTGEGTGLGLSMSYDIIVGGHGGNLTCRDTGDGAEFTITLPR